MKRLRVPLIVQRDRQEVVGQGGREGPVGLRLGRFFAFGFDWDLSAVPFRSACNQYAKERVPALG
jgi:hypothetical protein